MRRTRLRKGLVATNYTVTRGAKNMSRCMNLSLVVPAYNEAARIEAVLSQYCNHFPNEEIIVVCNGCSDRTPDIVRKLRCEHPQIRLLRLKNKLGKGRAIAEGFKAAEKDKVGFVDADESVGPDDVERMCDALASVDGVVASRRLRDSRILVRQPLLRRMASRAFNMIVRVVFGLHFRDTQCGAKVFKREAVADVLGELGAKGFEFDVELLWRLKRKGYEVVEFPISWKHSEGSTFSLWHAPRMLLSLAKVRLWK